MKVFSLCFVIATVFAVNTDPVVSGSSRPASNSSETSRVTESSTSSSSVSRGEPPLSESAIRNSNSQSSNVSQQESISAGRANVNRRAESALESRNGNNNRNGRNNEEVVVTMRFNGNRLLAGGGYNVNFNLGSNGQTLVQQGGNVIRSGVIGVNQGQRINVIQGQGIPVQRSGLIVNPQKGINGISGGINGVNPELQRASSVESENGVVQGGVVSSGPEGVPVGSIPASSGVNSSERESRLDTGVQLQGPVAEGNVATASVPAEQVTE